MDARKHHAPAAFYRIDPLVELLAKSRYTTTSLPESSLAIAHCHVGFQIGLYSIVL